MRLLVVAVVSVALGAAWGILATRRRAVRWPASWTAAGLEESEFVAHAFGLDQYGRVN